MLPRTDDTTVFMLLAEATGRGKGGERVFIWLSKVLEEKDCASDFPHLQTELVIADLQAAFYLFANHCN